jgi:transitional endoplasmic reticulum ATPase
LFFDEVDALGANRSDLRQTSSRFIINQFLDELDGVKYSNEGILILAATNTPWFLDTAFRRPGRFDRIIFVAPPDAEAREEIFKIHLAAVPTEGVKIPDLVKLTEDYSGADLKAVIDIAIEAKLPESMRQGKVIPVSQSDLKNAITRHRPSTKEWFATAKNHALYANESGLYDDVLKYLKIKK